MRRLVVGCGYLGARVAARWRDAGDEVALLTRSTERAQAWKQADYRAIVADVMTPASLEDLPSASTVLFAVGYDRCEGRPIYDVYVEGLRNVLASLPNSTARLIYVSSTGVFGDSDGDWVDEATPCRPQREGGRASWAAEQVLSDHPLGARAIVLRMAGIYGPGRIPRQAAILAGEPIAAPTAGYLNLIHVDDAAQVVVAAAEHAPAPRTYLVSDGNPGRRSDYYQELARLLGAPPPHFVEPKPDAPAALCAAADKRISNARMLAEIPVTLRYPSFREGLAACLKVSMPLKSNDL